MRRIAKLAATGLIAGGTLAAAGVPLLANHTPGTSGPEGDAGLYQSPVPGLTPVEEREGDAIMFARRQMLINERIAQAAVRRLNAVEAWLDAGIQTRDIAPGSILARDFHRSVVTRIVPQHPLSAASPRPVEIAPASDEGLAADLSPARLAANQAISQAAVQRASALAARLDGRLTGGDVRDGAVTLGKLAARLGIRSVARTPAGILPPSRTRVTVRPPVDADLALTARQLLVNQRIAQAAVLRANQLIARLQRGLTGANFRDRSLTAADLAPALRRPGG